MKADLLKVMILNIAFSCLLVHAKNPQEQKVGLNAHVHGSSELMIVMEGRVLEIQFISPAINLIGFEHQAMTKQDIAIVKNTASLLGEHDELFSFSGSRCSLINSVIDTSDLIKRDEHKEGHAIHDTHTQIVSKYNYDCEVMSKSLTITATLFDTFSNIQQVRVMWITDKKQGAVTLNAENKTINLW
ncbi:MAG: hypothetical protein COA59_16030 [Colwellia sp.]|nr:MAG: hypothetical protein COA59_16030 [Colwellia sp.]